MILVGVIFVALFTSVHASLKGLDKDGLIPSDGFHDLLGLVPFWMAERSSIGLQRTLGSESHALQHACVKLLIFEGYPSRGTFLEPLFLKAAFNHVNCPRIDIYRSLEKLLRYLEG